MLPSPAPAAVAAPPAPAEAVLTVAGVSLTFGDNHVLQDFSLTLNRGENIVVMGKSGAGKSVLIKCIIGLLKPDAGTITVLGRTWPPSTTPASTGCAPSWASSSKATPSTTR